MVGLVVLVNEMLRQEGPGLVTRVHPLSVP